MIFAVWAAWCQTRTGKGNGVSENEGDMEEQSECQNKDCYLSTYMWLNQFRPNRNSQYRTTAFVCNIAAQDSQIQAVSSRACTVKLRYNGLG